MSESFSNAAQVPLRYLKIFFRRKWLLAVPAVIGVVAGIITGAFLPKEYESSSLVLVEEEKTLNPLISGIAVSVDIVSRMRTIREQILGWNSLVQLVERLDLDKNVKTQIQFEQLVLGLRNKIKVLMNGPSLIRIAYVSKDPAEAKRVVQTVNAIFIEENMRTQEKESSVAISFLKDQIKVYRRKIKESEIADMKDNLKKLLVDSTEEHPMVKDLRARIVEAEKDLTDVNFDVEKAKPMPVGSNTGYEGLIKQQIDAAIQGLSVDANAKSIVPLDQVNPAHTGSNENIYQLLLLDKLDTTTARDAMVNENIYNMLLSRLETAKITQRLEASKQGTRYTVLDPPRLPLRPIKPNKFLVMIMGLFLGGACGVGIVLLLEFTDHSFLGIDEAKEFLDIPILGGISKILTEEDIAVTRAKNRFRTTVFTVASLLLIVLSSLYSFLRK
ncbi:MAG: hypothetical protein HZB36_08115 [Candidatus Omnitrophica bacterium]|nr:hypothetical protein [Candidatus Omnitrophota bacterium]